MINKKVYQSAVKAIEYVPHYTGDLVGDATAYLKHYYPNVPEADLKSDVAEAVSDVFFGGCEPEIQ